MTKFTFKLCPADSFFLMPNSLLSKLNELDESALKVLCLLSSGTVRDERTLGEALHYPPEIVERALGLLVEHGVLEKEEGTLRPVLLENKPATRRKRSEQRPLDYTMEEIDYAKSQNPKLADLLQIAQLLMKKPLNPSETKLLYSFSEWYGVSVEAIVILLDYCVNYGKNNLRYVEKIIIEWNESGLVAAEDAEAYVEKLIKKEERESEIRAVFGIGSRPLSTAERGYLTRWIEEYQSPLELIALAYDKTVDAIGQPKMSYCNKILKDWADKGYRTAEDTEAEMKPAPKKKKKEKEKKEDSFDLNKYAQWSFEQIDKWELPEEGEKKDGSAEEN